MAALGCCDGSCRVRKPWISLPSACPRPPPRGRTARFSARERASSIVRSQVRMEDVAEIVHNKVLVAAAISGAIGQLAKPFTRMFFNGKREKEEEEEDTTFDLRAAIESGGFPSSHSSAVTAAATSLLLERGFSDSIFGLSVIYAALIMYDAQGVRREVGRHARLLNKKRVAARANLSRSLAVENREKNGASVMNSDGLAAAAAASVLTVDEKRTTIAAEEEEEEEEEMMVEEMLKEGVGHTEVEVVAGAILGISVSLFIYNFI